MIEDSGRNSFEKEAIKKRKSSFGLFDMLSIGDKIIEEVRKQSKKKVKEENYILHHLKP